MSSMFPPYFQEPPVYGFRPPYAGPPGPPSPFPFQAPGVRSPFSAVPFLQGQSLQTILPQVQNMLRMAQTIAPYVKQYYPVVRQLPTIMKLLSAAPALTASGNNPADQEPEYTESGYSNIEDIDAAPPKLFI